MASVQKMVVCDCDGTLLPHGEQQVSPAVFDVIRRLTGKGVLFVIASGRPYDQLQQLFRPVCQQVMFICMDGALIVNRECVLAKKPVPDAKVRELLAAYPDVLLFGRRKQAAFGNPKFPGQPCSSLFAMGEPVLRVGVNTNDACPCNGLRPIYREDGWVELVSETANKGSALRTLCSKFDIDLANVYAFGDNDNDVELLGAVGHPYRMMDSKGDAINAFRAVRSVTDTLREEFHLPNMLG